MGDNKLVFLSCPFGGVRHLHPLCDHVIFEPWNGTILSLQYLVLLLSFLEPLAECRDGIPRQLAVQLHILNPHLVVVHFSD